MTLLIKLSSNWLFLGIVTTLSFLVISSIATVNIAHSQSEPCLEGSSQGAPDSCDTQFDIVPKNNTVCERNPEAVLCGNANNEQGGSGDNKLFGPSGVLTDITNIFALVVGIAAVIMVIIGGFQYVTSAGDSNKISTAKNTVLYALIGLVVVAFARTIIIYIIEQIT